MAKADYRSEKEASIAGMLRHYNLSFRYEHPLAIKDRGRTRLWYPDYLLPDQGLVIEYCGLNGNSDYDAGVQHKKEVYSLLGVPVLFLEPDDLTNHWPSRILGWMEDVQASRLRKVRSARSRGR